MNMPTFLTQNTQDSEEQWYFLAHYSQQLTKHIVNYGDSHNLYQGTDLNDAKDLSPILITINNDQRSALLNDIECERLKGLMLATKKTVQLTILMQQLRQRLFVKFDKERKAIFHFQNPRVASHFFRQSLAQDTHAWMGNIKKLAWLDNVPWGSQQWEMIENNSLNLSQDASKTWLLTPSQENALLNTIDDSTISYFFECFPEHYTQPQDWRWCYDILNYGALFSLEHIDDFKTFLALSFEFRPFTISVLKNQHEQSISLNQSATLQGYQIALQSMQENTIHGQ
ncbi:hypothetical protein C9J41_20160 [Photobacterium sp. GB-50]|uniref:DUF4123 domain-containing protein n=1 Tax=Photobacterium sp. GB-50 TaxID=2022107 RepID=UPI000D16EAF5|nr:DUF4123 domain-containing protein [Photobacterium sp. GB-50]PSW71693.1 hypothetical protein C9J41_20160 [Photobacterium sp. GB-50]